jgi:class 3 adenylate cyclase
MGVIGGLLGLFAGLGAVVITVVTYGGRSWGITEMDLWAVAGRAMSPAMINGLVGLMVIPLVSGVAAYWPTRMVVQGTPLQTMESHYRPPRRVRIAGVLGRGSVRTRLVMGTALLLVILLIGLTRVVTGHARNYVEKQVGDTLAAVVQANATMIELALPPDASALAPTSLETGGMDPALLLRFRSLIDEMGAHGFLDFAVTDQDAVVIFGFDPNQIGTVLPVVTHDKVNTSVERSESQRLMTVVAPVRNGDGQVLGAVRLKLELAVVDDFVRDLRNALWGMGALFLTLGLGLSWAIGTPLVRGTRQLSAQASLVGQGRYEQVALSRRRFPRFDVSIRTRSTAALLLVAVLMVTALALIVIPIERRKTEEIVKETSLAATEWAGQASLALADESLELGQLTDLNQTMSLIQGMDLGQLQELNKQLQNENLAYSALLNQDGVIQFSDQLGLLGEEMNLPDKTELEETVWLDEFIWRISTPITQGAEGDQIGALQVGLSREGIELFLAESRNLFQMTGVIAVLVSVLLAQLIGGAISAPMSRMAADIRRFGSGDTQVQFDSSSRDELWLLAQAFNEMVVGIQEREWLRDMFGRFVSQEVAEAIQSGQVRLEGERRVVSVLFCDIRDFTSRSEKATPEEVVALLNEYLPVVIDAAQHHDGTVNKFGGDSTLIIYGAPKLLQESAHHALLTALEMRRNLAQLNRRLAEQGQASIRVGVGIDTGTVLAGAVGPPERQEYTVIGDTVNLASRLQSLNKDYLQHDIFISEQTYQALGNRRHEFKFIDLGSAPIRGKDEVVQVWAVDD